MEHNFQLHYAKYLTLLRNEATLGNMAAIL